MEGVNVANNYPAGIWVLYGGEAEKYDKRLVEGWKDDMDATLVFAGLFPATVTAFIIESYKNLKPDPAETTVTILLHISQQLAAGGQEVPPFTEEPFHVPHSVLRANIFLFLSLGFSLACAFLAILVKQWARNYLHATQCRPTPLRRARIRSYLYSGVQMFQLPALVDGIPTFLHFSLFLFFAGLFEFFAPTPIHPMIRYLALAILSICAGLYLVATIVASLFPNCPYQSPLSAVGWQLFRVFQLFQRHHNPEPKMASTLIQEMESTAMGDIGEKKEVKGRDLEALHWLLESLTDNDELEPFVAGIPDFLGGNDTSDSYGMLRNFLLDKEASLGHRTLALLESSDQPGVRESIRERRAVACINAIWSITSASLEQSRQGDNHWRFYTRIDPPLEGYRSTPISALRRFTDDESIAMASRAKYALLIFIAKGLQDLDSHVVEMEDETPEKRRSETQENSALKQEALDALAALWLPENHVVKGMALPQIVGMDGSHAYWSSMKDARVAALILIFKAAFNNPSLPNFSLPYPTARGSIAGYLTQNLTRSPLHPTTQRLFVQAVGNMVSEVLLGQRGSRVNWKMVEEQIPLLEHVDDPDGIEEAIEVMQRCDRDETPWRTRDTAQDALRIFTWATTRRNMDATKSQRQEDRPPPEVPEMDEVCMRDETVTGRGAEEKPAAAPSPRTSQSEDILALSQSMSQSDDLARESQVMLQVEVSNHGDDDGQTEQRSPVMVHQTTFSGSGAKDSRTVDGKLSVSAGGHQNTVVLDAAEKGESGSGSTTLVM